MNNKKKRYHCCNYNSASNLELEDIDVNIILVLEIVPTNRSIRGTGPVSRCLLRNFLEEFSVNMIISITRLIPGTGSMNRYLSRNYLGTVPVLEIVPTTRSIPGAGPMFRCLLSLECHFDEVLMFAMQEKDRWGGLADGLRVMEVCNVPTNR